MTMRHEPFALLVDGHYVALPWAGGCYGYGVDRQDPTLWAFIQPRGFLYIGPPSPLAPQPGEVGN